MVDELKELNKQFEIYKLSTLTRLQRFIKDLIEVFKWKKKNLRN